MTNASEDATLFRLAVGLDDSAAQVRQDLAALARHCDEQGLTEISLCINNAIARMAQLEDGRARLAGLASLS